MDFITMQTEVADQTGLDLSTNATRIKRWLNIAQRDIAWRWPWQFLQSRETVQTIPDYTTGTVSVAAGGTSITGSGTTFTSAMVGRFIQFEGANDWYEIATYSSATAITITTSYNGTSSLSAGTFIIRKFFYSLSSEADTIIDIKNWNTPLKLVELDARMLDALRPNPQSAGTSSTFITWGLDSSGNVQISPYPFPTDARNLEIRTLKRITDLSANSDESIIPPQWHQVICYGADWMGYAYKNQFDQATRWETLYERKIDEMKTKSRLSEDITPVLQPMDATRRSNFLRMPDGYGILR